MSPSKIDLQSKCEHEFGRELARSWETEKGLLGYVEVLVLHLQCPRCLKLFSRVDYETKRRVAS